MIERLKDLGLDPELCQRQRDVLAGLGAAYMGEAASADDHELNELLALSAATNYRRAGANSLLIDDTENATKCFAQAAFAYIRSGSPYATFVANLAGPQGEEFRPIEQTSDPRDVFLLWTVADSGEYVPSLRFRQALESYRTRRIGVLGLEVGAYLDLFDSAVVGASDDTLAQNLLPIVAAYAMGVKQARRDRHHWTRLATAFHPAEPDVLALLVALSRRLRRQQRAVAPLVLAMPLGEDSLTLLAGALGQLGAWQDDRPSLR